MQNFKTVAQTLLEELAHFGFCPPKIGFFRGLGGVPKIFFFIGIFLIVLLGSPCKNLKSYDTPFYGFEQSAGGERREREIMPSLMATSALAHALRSDQFSMTMSSLPCLISL